jgi:very-short-patch-repair endonuclease
MVYIKIITEAKHHFNASLGIRDKARKLRKNMTPSEKILWRYIKNRQLKGMYFRRQHPYGIYIIDFFALRLI